MIRIHKLLYSKDRNFQICIEDLHIRPGEKVLMLGPSGSGKSTILRLIAGLENAETGQIILDGVNTSEAFIKPHERGISLLSQEYGLWGHMRVIEHLAFARTRGKNICPGKTDEDLLKMVQIENKKNKYPGELSGGEQQRLALARAFASEPKILLLDEPFSHLDMVLSHELSQLTDTISKKQGLTMIQVSHEPIRFNQETDKIIIIEKGTITQQGKWEEISTAPVSRWTQKMVGCMS